ncbi:MAG: alpha/beta fold hydrolase [Myxococcales bacterium]|nr:alpha/beta fold hydrolase [Myxococcales bacterium]
MQFASAAGIDLCYETFGDRSNPPLLLIMGLGCQLVHWPEPLCQRLAEHGFWVIRFDNRDVGLSSKLDHLGVPNVPRLVLRKRLGLSLSVPYQLRDLADDAFHLLDALGIRRAHIVGVSMGGMIAQLMTLRRPERVLSLCSWMSTTGDPRVGRPSTRAMRALLQKPPRVRAALPDHAVAVFRVIGSRGALLDEQRVRETSLVAFDRSPYRLGFARQLAAALAAPPRDAALARVRAPTLVLHGRADALINSSGGVATASAIPGAELRLFDDVGHDIPRPLWPEFAAAIAGNSRRAAAD